MELRNWLNRDHATPVLGKGEDLSRGSSSESSLLDRHPVLPSKATPSMLHGINSARHGGATQFRASKLKAALRPLCTLAIESSCDDTCVAIIETGRQDGGMLPTTHFEPIARLHFNEKITLDSRAREGIHPIDALYSHRQNLAKLLARSFLSLPLARSKIPNSYSKIIIDENGTKRYKPDFVSVTRGPGMRSNLSCGLDTAKGLAVAWGVPLLAVNHMQAHALTPRLVSAISSYNRTEDVNLDELLEDPKSLYENYSQREIDSNQVEVKPEFPFLTLLVSGGHTLLLHSKSLTDHAILASTVDIAIGDALDKIGRLVLPKEILESAGDTAFAKHLSLYAFPDGESSFSYSAPVKRGDELISEPNQYGWNIQSPFAQSKRLVYSFTGIASRVESLWAERSKVLDISDDERRLFARTALRAAFEHLASRVVIALNDIKEKKLDISTLVVSGGVAANKFLRVLLRAFLSARGFPDIQLVFPPPELCTDNAAMIAWTGIEMFEAGFRSDLGCFPLAKWSMDSEADDGGIAGIGGWQVSGH